MKSPGLPVFLCFMHRKAALARASATSSVVHNPESGTFTDEIRF